MEKIKLKDWRAMNGQEKERHVFKIIGVDPEQLDTIIREFVRENGKKPNAIFISWETLAELLPIRLKKITRLGIRLQVIPMESGKGQFVLSLQDPYTWGDLFFK